MDELEALEQLMDELLRGIQETIQSGEILTDEFQAQLAQELSATTTRIDQLRATQQTIPSGANLGNAPTPGQQLMWILAGQQEDAFINYLRTYPDPELNQLAGNPGELNRVLNYLRQMMPPGGQPPTQDGIEHAPINSSNIYGFKYDPKTGKLLVRFQGGSVYGYNGVPPGVFKVFQQGAVPAKTEGQNNYGRWWRGKQPSLGAAFYEMIRNGGYPYQRLS